MKKLFSVLPLFITISLAACSKGDDDNSPPNTYPKEVSVMYRVSSPSAIMLNSSHYTNETGGIAQAKNFELPFSKSVSMTVNNGKGLYLSYFDPNGPNVKLEILVDNAVVKTQTFTGNSGAIDYYFQ